MAANLASPHPLCRVLTRKDLDRVCEIEQAAYAFPWTRIIFADCLRVGYECWGLQLGSALVGYSIVSYAAGEAHLLNLCIHPHWHRQGLGSLMLEYVIVRACRHGCACIFLEVRPSNPAGLALYRKRGFDVIGERPNYYRSHVGRESAVVMRLDLSEAPPEFQASAPIRHDPF